MEQKVRRSLPNGGRSPAYPGLDLQRALARAGKLYEEFGTSTTPLADAFKAWGLGERSSTGREIKAALRYFGLITSEGDRAEGHLKLTDMALDVLVEGRVRDEERETLIRSMALAPTIHRHLFATFPDGIQSDIEAKKHLIAFRGFKRRAAAELVDQFRETAEFAKLYARAEAASEAQQAQGSQQDIRNAAERELLAGHLSKETSFRLLVSGTVDPAAFARLIQKLELEAEIVGDREVASRPEAPERRSLRRKPR